MSADPVTRLLQRWEQEATLFRRTGHPGARMRREDIAELRLALASFVNEPLSQIEAADLMGVDPSTLRRLGYAGVIRNVGGPHRPRYLRGEVQKLPGAWGLADGDLREEVGDAEGNTADLPDDASDTHSMDRREQVARAIARGGADG